MLKRYLNYLGYTFTKGTDADDYDVLLAVIPFGAIVLLMAFVTVSAAGVIF